MKRTTRDVATVIYTDLQQKGPRLACNLARSTGLKYSTVRSFLGRMEKVGSVRRGPGTWGLWAFVPEIDRGIQTRAALAAVSPAP